MESAEIGKLAVRTGVWPLKEYIDGKVTHTKILHRRLAFLKYSSTGKPGGLLTIKTFIEDEDVVLAVQDHGKGIEPYVLEKIGSPFFTTKDNGTGLGLAVCYGIAARHKARINTETSSSGTTFFVRFKRDPSFA